MPKRIPVDQNLVLSIYEETHNACETARRMGIHESTVYTVLKRHQGRCVTCGKPVNPGNSNCPDCKKHWREYRKQKRKELKREGLCTVCGEPRDSSSRLYCAKHRKQHILRSEKYNQRLRDGIVKGTPTEKNRERRLRSKYGEGGIVAWKRHNGTCSMCGISHNAATIHVHHIDADDTNHASDNLITLCFRCHRLVHLVIEYPDLKKAVSWLKETYPALPI